MRKGLFIVIPGPSGVGKGTICDILMKNKHIDLEYSVSMTTREKRDYEQEGVHYYFTNKIHKETKENIELMNLIYKKDSLKKLLKEEGE